MKTFDVQAVEISASFEKTFDYIAEARNLPEWTNAFKTASDGRALLETPNGSVEVGLKVTASRQHGTIDWTIAFPDQSEGNAYSRIISVENKKSIYSFILMAPPVPLEQLEGVLEDQSRILREELSRLRTLLEK
jgi:hypothetical protein